MSESALITAIKALAKDIQAISGHEVTWKDADPRLWSMKPLSFSRHGHEHCMKAKSSSEGMQRCSNHCSYPRPDNDQPQLVNCPYGVRELRIPLFIGQHYLGTLSIGHWRGPQTKHMQSQLKKSHKQLADKDDATAKALMRLIIPRLQQCALLHHADMPIEQSERFADCIAYIQEHLHLQLRAASVAHVLNLSTSRFIHWFKEQSGMPYRHYIQQEVLKECAKQLMHDQKRILDIALDAGYHSPSAFAAAFKQHYGVQPSVFKKTMRNVV